MLLCIERLLCPSVTNIDLGATFPGANIVQGKNTLGYLHTRILHTGKKVRLQIRIDHKMFDIFTSRNVKKETFNIHSHVRPKCPTKTKMSDQIVGLRECWLSNLSDICQTFWEFDRWYTWSVLYVGCTVICHCSIVIDDHSRVIIQGNTSSDYINANNIDVSFV